MKITGVRNGHENSLSNRYVCFISSAYFWHIYFGNRIVSDEENILARHF